MTTNINGINVEYIFMQDMVEHLDKQYFPNATIQQINDFAHSAVDFWKGKITSPGIEHARTPSISPSGSLL